jgi:hypothetical protein
VDGLLVGDNITSLLPKLEDTEKHALREVAAVKDVLEIK